MDMPCTLPFLFHKPLIKIAERHQHAILKQTSENLLNLLQNVLLKLLANARGLKPLMEHPDGFIVANCD
ncbi:hypothetical protein EJB05_48971, partial [Eragrostis curvula]